MNSPQSNPNHAVEEQAALWAARLDGDVLDASQRQALDQWLAASPLHRQVLSQYCQLSADLEEQLPRLLRNGGLASPSATISATARKRTTFPRVIGFTLAAAAAVALGVWTFRPAPLIQNVATAVAQRQTHTLADGTRVDLNAHTSLRFENKKTERRARLAGGEALFAVTKDPVRPFFVDTPAGSVRVTGTTFNVRIGVDGGFQVTVVEGSVQVSPGGSMGEDSGPVPLVANEQFSSGVGGSDKRTLSAEQRENALAWRQGKIAFYDTPLAEAVTAFARYHGRGIDIDPAVANEPIGGLHSLDDLNGFLSGIELALEVSVRQDLGGKIFVRQRRGDGR